jgi:hypothetical protein
MEIDYLELAKSFFLKLKKELQQEDSDSMGGISLEEFNVNCFKFKIEVDGFWEKATFFDYIVTDEFGKEIDKGNYCF